ncbi:probable ubiquitin-like-specific protease 2A isoform X2 [Abrus precatorius]|uniref:Probable ubiquitin-like-specific protease 2A isoform X2 n=1 Tax=Abrus precatorius TaxID=3816 RepID=A0A8B8LGS8_ABRPR|nr:probable ubiquitin-like-specific protease 2A isoform X2 [Abrus precatorius]
MTRRKRSSSSPSSTSKFDVFEFNKEDENIEKLSQRMCTKFANPSASRSSPITKYHFLQTFARGSEPLHKLVTADPIDLDAEQDEETKCSPEEVADKPLEVFVDDDDGGCSGAGIDNQGKCANPCSDDVPLQHCVDKGILGYTGFVDCDFDLKNQSFDVVSDDDDDNSQFNSSSTSTLISSEVEVDFGQQFMEPSTAFEINGVEKVVDVIPDFIQYEDIYSTRSRLIFSSCSLRLEGMTMNGTGGSFKIEWATEDIIKIESCWFGKIETALINLLLKSSDYIDSGNTNPNPGFKLLKFAVYNSYWYKAEEAIKLLDMRYMDIWSTSDIDTDNNGNISEMGLGSFFSQKRYFPIFDEEFDEVIYPKGELDAVSISKRDIELLQPETFINDTIIDFYIKYLKNKLPIVEQDRFHFFNSFFFRKLADLDKDPSSACDGKAAFQRVRKWTRKVKLFEKDYILIPINYSLHWSLIVICHPGEVACFKDEEIKESSKVPCILHMDSLKGSHKGLKNLFQSYLCEEWKERHCNVVDDISSKFLHLRFISLELPQQENLYDCGLFLLHYVECFLKEAPINFNPFMITKFSNFLNSDWFPLSEASLKRSHIQNLIYDIYENNSLRAPPSYYLEKSLPSEVPGIIKHKVEADSLGVCCSPAMWYGKNISNYTIELDADIKYPTTLSTSVASCLSEPGLVFKDLQAAVVTSHSECLQMSVCHRRGFMSPIMEIEESGEGTAISLERENSHVGILESDFISTSYVSNDHKASETSQHGCSVNFLEVVEDHSYSRMSTSRISWNTLNTATDEVKPLEKFVESSMPDKTAHDYLSTSRVELADSIVQDSPEANDGLDVEMSVKSCSNFQENMNLATDQIFDLAQNTSLEDDTSISKKEPLAVESDERDAKRPKHMNAGGPSRRFTRSMLKEACVMSCE